MSLALKLTSSGTPVFWVDKSTDVLPSRMRAQVRAARQKIVLAIDDADMYGRELLNLAADLVPRTGEFLLVFAMRSNKIDAVMQEAHDVPDLNIFEHIVP
ncbi:MAG: hypothetical protein ACRD4Q_12380, partial [Candidatus Acidiferrales bacterium]